MMEQLHAAGLWLVGLIGSWGYPGIVFLMFLESSFLPLVPSELVMPPAGYVASQGEMNLYLVILMGTIGSILGALLNYYLAAWLGRPFFLRYGRYFFLTPHKFEKMDTFFSNHGEISTFTGRLVPGVRHYISLFAGLTRMNRLHFIFYTGFGAAIWVGVLAVIGFVVGQNKELIMRYSRIAMLWTLFGCVVLVAAYAWWHRRRASRTMPREPPA